MDESIHKYWVLGYRNPGYCIKNTTFCKFLDFFEEYAMIKLWKRYFSYSHLSFSSQSPFFMYKQVEQLILRNQISELIYRTWILYRQVRQAQGQHWVVLQVENEQRCFSSINSPDFFLLSFLLLQVYPSSSRATTMSFPEVIQRRQARQRRSSSGILSLS